MIDTVVAVRMDALKQVRDHICHLLISCLGRADFSFSHSCARNLAMLSNHKLQKG